jgi:hypothetical protein
MRRSSVPAILPQFSPIYQRTHWTGFHQIEMGVHVETHFIARRVFALQADLILSEI